MEDIEMIEGPSGKRFKVGNRAMPDNDLKQRILQDIINVSKVIISKYSLDAHVHHITLMQQVCSAVYTLINACRRVYSTKNLDINSITHCSNIKYIDNGGCDRTISISLKDFLPAVKSSLACFGSASTIEPIDYFGAAMPIIDLLSLFGLRYSELRLGVTTFSTKKDSTVPKTPISTLGLTAAHSTLLEGITYPPERRSSVIMSLGACTIAHSLASQTAKEYKKKYEVALTNAIRHVPISKAIVDHFSTTGMRFSRPIMTELANLLLMTGDRHIHRIAIPFAVFYRMATEHIRGHQAIVYDSSGKQAYQLIHYMQSNKWSMNWAGSEILAKQFLFHVVMGTPTTSFNLLRAITDHNQWVIRSKYGDSFKEKLKSKIIVFDPIKMNFASKMSPASKNTLMAMGTGTLGPSEPFSGKYTRVFTRKELDSINDPGANYTATSDSPNAILANLNAIKRHIWNKIGKDGDRITSGTTEWYKIEDYVEHGSEAVPVHLNLESKGTNFYSAVDGDDDFQLQLR